MEMHHKLRRDPSWDPRGCNLCGQVGHQAAMCPNGNSVNWKGVYGEDEFVIKPPVFESQLRARRAMKRVDASDLTQRAREFAEAEALGMTYEQLLASGGEAAKAAAEAAEAAAKAKAEAAAAAPAVVVAAPPVPVSPLPPGWAVAHDGKGKPYYYHTVTKKTVWEAPTAATPIS